MKVQSLIFSGVILIAALTVSCRHDLWAPPTDPGNPTYGTGGCDTDTTYFQNQVLPILISNCTESGCHNAQDHREGVVLESFQSLISTVGHARENDMNRNKMMRAILASNAHDRMPPAPKEALSQDQIDLLKNWLAQGALNNGCDENAGGCDVANTTFGNFVQPLVKVKCQGCHSGSNPQGGVKLSNYSEIKTAALNGTFYASLTKASGWMPKGGSKLDDCSMQKIQQWIASGAPQN